MNLYQLPKKIEFLFKLSEAKIKKSQNLLDIEKQLGYTYGRTDLRIVLKDLIEKNILQYVETVGGYKRYLLNQKKLRILIENLDFYKMVYDQIEKYYTIL